MVFPQGSSEREAIATEEMSTLVNYVQPTKFNAFEASKSKKSWTENDTYWHKLVSSCDKSRAPSFFKKKKWRF